MSGPPGDLAVPPNGGGGVRKITWLNGYCPQYPQLDILIYFFFSLLPRLGSASPPFLSRPRASCALFLSSCALLRCPSFPPLRRFLSSSYRAVAALAQALSLATNKHSVSQQSNSAASCFLPEPALKYCNPDHPKLLLISIGSGASGKLREIYGNSTTDRIID